MIPDWLRAWWPAIVWGIVISLASTDSFSSEHTASVLQPILKWFYPALTTAQFEVIHHLIRKTAHFCEYFVFYLLLLHAVHGVRKQWQWSSAVIAWAIAAVYSCLDEFHQSFVASRGASPWDSLLDSIGAAVAMFGVYLFLRYRASRAARLSQ
jgi:VanZ family protein